MPLPRVCAKQEKSYNDNLCMYFAFENAFQMSSFKNHFQMYINIKAKNSLERFKNLIAYFEEILKQTLSYLGAPELIAELLLEGTDSTIVEYVLNHLKIPHTILTIQEYLDSKDKDFGPFAIIGLAGQSDITKQVELDDKIDVGLGHFVAWHRADSKNLTKGYLLDSLEFDKPVPNVDLLNWKLRGPSFSYLEQSKIIFIKE